MNAFYALYCLICLGLVYGVYRSSALDFRGVGRLSRRDVERGSLSEEDDFDDPRDVSDEAHRLRVKLRRLARLEVAPRADLHFLLMMSGLFAVATGAALGFLIPLGMEAASGDGAPSSAAGASNLGRAYFAAEQPMARLAQVVGAGSGAAIALRMFRIFVGLGALCVAVLLFLMAVNFVIGRPILALFGG